MRFNGLITKTLISVSLCVATAPAYANAACQGAGCVLPVADAPPPPPAEAVIVEEGGGIGIWPIIIGVAALALLAFLVLDNDDDEEPTSP